MAKYFKARKAKEVRVFLEAMGFILQTTHGDDTIYRREGFGFTVKIPSRDSDVIPLGTMSQIRKCVRNCGFSDKQILKWWKENNYGE